MQPNLIQQYLPIGHVWLLHICVSDLGSSQSAPPLVGGGLLHSLLLVWVPPAQLALHVVHINHGPQFPSVSFNVKVNFLI